MILRSPFAVDMMVPVLVLNVHFVTMSGSRDCVAKAAKRVDTRSRLENVR